MVCLDTVMLTMLGDVVTRVRSTTGYVFILHGGAVSWCSKRAADCGTYNGKPNTWGGGHAVKEGLWLRKLLGDLSMHIDTVAVFA
jgi:hypothetical protein